MADMEVGYRELEEIRNHDCRKCEAFSQCLVLAGTGTMAKCIWWNMLLKIKAGQTDDRPHAHWEAYYVCSNCGEHSSTVVAECPWCHARMDGEDT